MDALTLIIVLSLAVIVFVVGAAIVFYRAKAKKSPTPRPRPGIDYSPGVGDDDSVPRDTARKTVETILIPDVLADPTTTINEISPGVWEVEVPESAIGRLHKLRARLARSNSVFSKGLLGILTSGSLDQQTWDDVEATLLGADLGIAATTELIAALKVRIAQANDSSEDFLRQALHQELVNLLGPDFDRSLCINVDD